VGFYFTKFLKKAVKAEHAKKKKKECERNNPAVKFLPRDLFLDRQYDFTAYWR